MIKMLQCTQVKCNVSVWLQNKQEYLWLCYQILC